MSIVDDLNATMDKIEELQSKLNIIIQDVSKFYVQNKAKESQKRNRILKLKTKGKRQTNKIIDSESKIP